MCLFRVIVLHIWMGQFEIGQKSPWQQWSEHAELNVRLTLYDEALEQRQRGPGLR